MKEAPIILLLALFAATTYGAQFSFEGYKVWLVTATTSEQRAALHHWETYEKVDFWEKLPDFEKGVRIMVAPETQPKFVKFLADANIKNELIIQNVESGFELERRADARYRQRLARQPVAERFIPDFNHFWTTQEINDYLSFLLNFHGDICNTEVVGHSTNGQLMRTVTISQRGRGVIDGSRPIVYIDAGIHAREWATQTTAIYFIHQLVEQRVENRNLLENVDFVFLPNANPDGYDWSRTDYRLWRKTRARVVNATGTICYGIDGNRNYAHMWQEGLNACSDSYPGVAPFSEPETQAVRSVFDRYGDAIKLYVSVHSYGQYVLYPWGYEKTLIDNWEQHHHLGRLFADRILETTGTNYTVGNSAIALYPAFGASDDYSAFLGVETSFTFELPGGGRNGFDLPAERLFAVVTETWNGFREVLRYIAARSWPAPVPEPTQPPQTTEAPEE